MINVSALQAISRRDLVHQRIGRSTSTTCDITKKNDTSIAFKPWKHQIFHTVQSLQSLHDVPQLTYLLHIPYRNHQAWWMFTILARSRTLRSSAAWWIASLPRPYSVTWRSGHRRKWWLKHRKGPIIPTALDGGGPQKCNIHCILHFWGPPGVWVP